MMKRQITKLLTFFIIFTSAIAVAENLTKLEQLIAQSNYQQAWKKAQQLAKNYEGDPHFDYLYGVSALETGHYDLAVFALDRVTINQPNIIRPRLELARAYLKINNDIAALREFKEVLRLNPPATVQRNVNHYIQSMKKTSNKNRQWIIDGLATMAVGYDSNANFGAENSVFNTPVFGTVTLKESSTKQGSSVTELRTQLNTRYIVSDTQRWFIKSKLNHKQMTDAQAFSISELALQGGGMFIVGKQQYQLSLQNQLISLDNHLFSHTLGLQTKIAHELATNKILTTTLSLENYDHKQQNLRDTRRYGISGGYRLSKNNTRHQLGGSFGHERSKHQIGKHHTRNTTGISYQVGQRWNALNSSFISTQFQYNKHRASDPIYAKKRNDKRILLKIGHTLRLGGNLSAFATTGYTKNNSNLDIYDTKKAFVQLGIHYNF
jgi:hypothetical protein